MRVEKIVEEILPEKITPILMLYHESQDLSLSQDHVRSDQLLHVYHNIVVYDIYVYYISGFHYSYIITVLGWYNTTHISKLKWMPKIQLNTQDTIEYPRLIQKKRGKIQDIVMMQLPDKRPKKYHHQL